MNFKKFGKYTIIKKIASGGMADILLASNLSPTGFGHFVVIKRALAKFSENEDFKDMFKNEGKVACNLKHRNITPIYEFGIEKNQFFLSMEYISGKNLREFTKKLQVRKSAIDIPNAVHIMKEVASGLNYAHNAIDSNTGRPLKIIHRDVSPQNIMLSFDGEIKLIDFGIAKIADTNLTRAGHLKGKFSYMSPEQAYGEALDERTDIFCMGIIFWELLTNKRLFASRNELDSLKKVKNCNIPNAQKINPKIPTELNNIVIKALQKNKNLRYETAAKFEQDLNLFLNKKYSEYSHYDFVSLMKTVYRKEIMEERERLKNYATNFKKYLNTLNTEESLIRSQVSLNIPDLSTLIERNQAQKKTETLALTENSKLKDDSLLMHDSFSKTIKKEKTDQKKKDDTTTILQKNNLETKTTENSLKSDIQKIQKSTPLQLKTEQPFIETGKNQQSFFKTSNSTRTQSSTNKSTLYSKQNMLRSLQTDNQSEKRKLPFVLFLFFCLVITGFSFTAYWLINVNKKTADYKPNNFLKFTKEQAPIQTNLSHNNTNLYPASSEIGLKQKVLVESKPSGAAIFINNKFSKKHTPSLISLKKTEKSTITLKKEGYNSQKFTFDPKQKNTNSISLKLKINNERKISSEKIHIIE